MKGSEGGSEVGARQELGSLALVCRGARSLWSGGSQGRAWQWEAQALPGAGEGSFLDLWALITSLRVCFLVVLGPSACPSPCPFHAAQPWGWSERGGLSLEPETLCDSGQAAEPL